MSTEDQPASVMRSLERALEVMAVLQRRRAPMRLSDVAREAGLHLATTQRILNVLARFDYVQQDAAGYTLGITSLLNAHTFLVSDQLSLIARPVLQELSSTSGLTASLSIRVKWSQVLVVRVEGPQPLRYQLPVGEQLPLHLGGARVLAAAMTSDDLDDMIGSLAEIRLATGQTLTREEFRESLKEIRILGFAFGTSQRLVDAASIAVPVHSRDGRVVAGLQLSGLAEDFTALSITNFVGELKRASEGITRRIPIP